MKFSIPVLFIVLALFLGSCLFDQSGQGPSQWMEEQGLPSSLVWQKVTVDGIQPTRLEVGLDSLPLLMSLRAGLGEDLGTRHQLFFDFFAYDSAAIRSWESADSVWFDLRLVLDSAFYHDSTVAPTIPMQDSVSFLVQWSLQNGDNANFQDSLDGIADSIWQKEMLGWLRNSGTPSDSATVRVAVNVTEGLDTVLLPLPGTLRTAMQGSSAFRLMISVTPLDAPRIYRVYGASQSSAALRPAFSTKASFTLTRDDGKTTQAVRVRNYDATRMAQAGLVVNSGCAGCLEIHGGIRESLLVDLPAAQVLQALAAHYGDAFPIADSGFDARQIVLMASLRVPVDSARSGSELGLPVPLLVYGRYDSLQSSTDTSWRLLNEPRRLDTVAVALNGHGNLLFHGLDTLDLQATLSVRRLLNAAAQGAGLQLSFKLGRPMLQPYDLRAYDYYDSTGTLVKVYSDFGSYARANLTRMQEQDWAMDLWLATGREDQE